MHLLCGKPDLSAIAAMGSGAKKTAAPELEERIEKLEAQVEQLHKLVEKLLDLNGVSLEDLCQ